ncbi:MAG: type II secretion system protein GspD [Prevotellaceae bacterium]|jgi:type IV pilus assembly protein PilQ|nr:type II secretion system protein GspD [Prevotellaceae bacterium]
MKNIKLLLLLLAFVSVSLSAQDTLQNINTSQKLRQVTQIDPSFDKEIDISAGKSTLTDLLRNVATVSGVNLNVKGAENIIVNCNFTRLRVADLIEFLCNEYNLEINVTGNIVSIFPVKPPIPEAPKNTVEYDIDSQTLSFDLNGEKLINLSKKIAEKTNVNVIIPQNMYNYQIYGYANSMPVDDALQTLASVNGLLVSKDAKGVWTFNQNTIAATTENSGRISTPYRFRTSFQADQLSVDSLGMVTAHIGQGNIQDIITELCNKMALNHFFITPVDGQTGIYVNNVDLETLLSVILSGTQYSYYKENGIYFFGASGVAQENRNITAVKNISLTFRSVAKVEEIIPANIKSGLQIKTFPDLNSLIVSGDQRSIYRVESFLKSVDKPVPLITIEIIIADVMKSDIKETGLGMGIGKSSATTAGTLSPGVDMSLGAASVNSLITRFNGFGSINLGKVTPNFYMDLKLLEENGTVELLSTPRLSTLNGHEASLKSGETRYYKEVTNNYFGTQNPIQSEFYTWKNIEANLSIKITPYVSLDEKITLEIEIEQSEFTEREEESAPPGSITRSFKSQITVQNEDMVLLGGIDKNTKEKSSKGLPFLARIPVIKWLFGSTKNNKVDRKLNVFIKPTIIH